MSIDIFLKKIASIPLLKGSKMGSPWTFWSAFRFQNGRDLGARYFQKPPWGRVRNDEPFKRDKRGARSLV